MIRKKKKNYRNNNEWDAYTSMHVHANPETFLCQRYTYAVLAELWRQLHKALCSLSSSHQHEPTHMGSSRAHLCFFDTIVHGNQALCWKKRWLRLWWIAHSVDPLHSVYWDDMDGSHRQPTESVGMDACPAIETAPDFNPRCAILLNLMS